MRGLSLSGDREQGSSLIETAVGLTLFAFGMIGTFGLLLSSMGALAVGKERNATQGVVNSRVEAARGMLYEDVVLSSLPQHSDDQSNPNFNVSTGYYTFDGSQSPEPLLVDTLNPNGLVPGPVPFTVGSIKGETYQYVTAATYVDPLGTHTYKRLTVVARWTGGGHTGSREAKIVSLVSPKQ